MSDRTSAYDLGGRFCAIDGGPWGAPYCTTHNCKAESPKRCLDAEDLVDDLLDLFDAENGVL